MKLALALFELLARLLERLIKPDEIAFLLRNQRIEVSYMPFPLRSTVLQFRD
jgi:uncharacterized protein (DUF2336 family)